MYSVKCLLNVLVLQLLLQLCSSLDTIKFGQTVGGGDFLVSKSETFVLGFFSPGTSTNRYVGIWYNFSKDMVVWVANRDNPINGSSGVLSIGSDGNLVLQANTSQGLIPLWSTNVSISSESNDNIVAQILDTGNLVLVQQGSSQHVFWQSSDHPTNILLPNNKIGLDRRSGINRFLTCWNSDNDPGTGNVSLEMDLNGSPELILYKNEAKWWRSGQWNGINWGGLPAVQRNVVFKINFVNNKNEIAVQSTVLDPLIYSVNTIDRSGTLKQLVWEEQRNQWVPHWSSPYDACDSYGKCGKFGTCNPTNIGKFNCKCYPGYEPISPQDWDLKDGRGGCKRQQGSRSICRNGEGFVKMENVKVPDTSSIKLGKNLSLEVCEEECLKNCTCLAYAIEDVTNGGTGCMTWYRDLIDTRQFTEGGQDLYVRADAVVLAQYKKKPRGGFSSGKRRLALILGVSISVASLLILVVLCWFRKRSMKGRGGQPKFLNDPTASGVRSYEDFPIKYDVDEHRGERELPFFDLTTVVAATENFSSANMLGHGGFGMVYKGCLADGQEIAVKRLSRNSGQGIDEFKNEVMLIAKLQHRNLVRLLGCCIHKEERMLIYEYMPNRSLDLCLFDKNRKSLDWRKRFQIIIGIARGVLYLHQDSRLKIIHRDLKASNVLLNGSMNPKISDFGLARMFGDDQIEANTNKVVGTYGYMSPEYAMDGLYSTKSDVFSFGVLALEIISGRKNSFQFENSSLNLVGIIWDLWTEGKVLDIIDSSLNQSYSTHEVMRYIQIGLLCVQEYPTDRPTMLDVVFMLGNETTLPRPKKAAFSLKNNGPNSSTSKGASSVNDVTITVIEAR